ncbi:Major Facilitator Superfamily [Aspergillus sclerotialis]|uniref:Major Facilitator Superfamily n=1 Tax=Aspergillus sclerotialis TaxID=2070753 RepID=A0A3A2ZR90_9EURO|nr:Major Facilitator Superfamily [Aspergillus sclerotialis]
MWSMPLVLGCVSGGAIFWRNSADCRLQRKYPNRAGLAGKHVRGNWRRAFCSALLIMGGGTGGIVCSLVFRSQDAPTYRPGIEASIVASALIIIIAIILMLQMYTVNKKAATGAVVLEGLPSFRYTL